MSETSTGPGRSNDPAVWALRAIVFDTAEEFYGLSRPEGTGGAVPFYQYQDAIIGRFSRYCESVACDQPEEQFAPSPS